MKIANDVEYEAFDRTYLFDFSFYENYYLYTVNAEIPTYQIIENFVFHTFCKFPNIYTAFDIRKYLF